MKAKVPVNRRRSAKGGGMPNFRRANDTNLHTHIRLDVAVHFKAELPTGDGPEDHSKCRKHVDP